MPDTWRKHGRPSVALVIGSGGYKCAAAVGLIKVLEREAIDVDMVIGCSGGSIYAACVALRYSAAKIESLSQRLWTKEVLERRYYPSFLRMVLPQVFGYNERFGLMDDRPAMQGFRIMFGDQTIEQASIPLYLMATDMRTGDRVILTHGRIVDAIRASTAIPIVFGPWEVDGRLLVDGGASDPLPVDVAIKEGAQIIIAMGFESHYTSEFRSIANLVNQMSSIMINNLLKSSYAFHNLAHHAELIPIIPEFDRRMALGDPDLIPYLIERGERATEAQAPYLRRLLAGAAEQP